MSESTKEEILKELEGILDECDKTQAFIDAAREMFKHNPAFMEKLEKDQFHLDVMRQATENLLEALRDTN